MVSGKTKIKNPTGLHLRPAGLFCKTAMQFASKITVRKQARNEEITANENMKAYEAAKKELDGILNKVMQILSLAANGHDVDAIDLNGEISSCAGDCGSCGGCH